LGDKLLPVVKDLFGYLEQVGKPYFSLTNNSSRSRKDYVVRMAGYGLQVERANPEGGFAWFDPKAGLGL
jgi:ribonucleotide monophosphatase NagD (HAD superfamily)